MKGFFTELQSKEPIVWWGVERRGDKHPDLSHLLLSDLLLVPRMIENQPKQEGKGTWKMQLVEDSLLRHRRVESDGV